jgi:hypothetical protein
MDPVPDFKNKADPDPLPYPDSPKQSPNGTRETRYLRQPLDILKRLVNLLYEIDKGILFLC